MKSCRNYYEITRDHDINFKDKKQFIHKMG